MYPAKILVANPSSFDVVFYDGFKKTVQHANVKPMTREMRREFHLPDDGTTGNTCLFGEKKKSGKQVFCGRCFDSLFVCCFHNGSAARVTDWSVIMYSVV